MCVKYNIYSFSSGMSYTCSRANDKYMKFLLPDDRIWKRNWWACWSHESHIFYFSFISVSVLFYGEFNLILAWVFYNGENDSVNKMYEYIEVPLKLRQLRNVEQDISLLYWIGSIFSILTINFCVKVSKNNIDYLIDWHMC